MNKLSKRGPVISSEMISGMDGKLAVLEQRRERTRTLKQSMTQERLTGRTRLL